MYNIDSSPTVTNCILWGDTPDEVNDVNSTSIVTYSDVQGSWSGEGNIEENPLLYHSAGGELLLTPWSPCIDTGSNEAVAPDATDFTGKPRLVDGDCNGTITVDMGANEFRHAYGGDFDSSCLVNMADYAVLGWAWLAGPQSENWDPVCDISIPADGHIDAGDVRVLSGNWLRSIEAPVTCDANRLKDEFGLDAGGAVEVLTELCGITDPLTIEQTLYAAGYEPNDYLEFTALPFVKKFAPILYFDKVHMGLPMSAQVYFETVMTPFPDYPSYGQITWGTPKDGPCGRPGVISLCGRDYCTCGMSNNDFSTLVNGQIPTYYKVISDIDSNEPTGDKGRLRIWYWWFYGFQAHCNFVGFGPDGAHHGDWEHVIVTTDPNRTRAEAVTYSFHGDWYTRLSGGFETEPNDDPQGRPVVYVGRLSHGNWHSDESSCLWAGEAYHCCTYADCRTPDANTIWRTANENLVSLSGNSEPWMRADRIGETYEFSGREYTISDWRWGPHISYEPYPFKWEHTHASGTHPTTETFNWTIASCDEEGCGTDYCEGLISRNYPSPRPYYNQGWPWWGSASSAAESATFATSATSATYGSVASCGRCGASRFSALARLGNYWLATP
jgi:hypothetical protein